MIERDDLIPQELANRKQWVRWQKIYDPDKNHFNKIPYTIYPKIKAKTNDPETWTTFDIVDQVDTHDGIAFVFDESDPYVFIDLDKVVIDGIIEPEYETILKEAIELGGWVERSVSKTGFHIILKGNIPKNANPSNSKLEFYSNKRFMAMTLDVVNCPKEIGDGQSLIDKIYPKDTKEKAIKVQKIKKEINDDSPVSYKFRIPNKIYTMFEILKNKKHGENVEFVDPNTGEIKLYKTRSEAEGFIIMHSVVAGYTKENAYNLFKQYNTGTFSEENNQYAYIENYYQNAKIEFWKSDIRLELSSIDVYKIDLKYTNPRQEANVRLVLQAIIETGIRYNKFDPYISYRQIQEMCNIGSTKTVSKAINKLVEEGIIQVNYSQKQTDSNSYLINIKGNISDARADKEYVSLLRYTLDRSEFLVYQTLTEGETIKELSKRMNRAEKTLEKTLRSLQTKGFVSFEDGQYRKILVDLNLYKEEIEYWLSEKQKKHDIERKIQKERLKQGVV